MNGQCLGIEDATKEYKCPFDLQFKPRWILNKVTDNLPKLLNGSNRLPVSLFLGVHDDAAMVLGSSLNEPLPNSFASYSLHCFPVVAEITVKIHTVRFSLPTKKKLYVEWFTFHKAHEAALKRVVQLKGNGWIYCADDKKVGVLQADSTNQEQILEEATEEMPQKVQSNTRYLIEIIAQANYSPSAYLNADAIFGEELLLNAFGVWLRLHNTLDPVFLQAAQANYFCIRIGNLAANMSFDTVILEETHLDNANKLLQNNTGKTRLCLANVNDTSLLTKLMTSDFKDNFPNKDLAPKWMIAIALPTSVDAFSLLQRALVSLKATCLKYEITEIFHQDLESFREGTDSYSELPSNVFRDWLSLVPRELPQVTLSLDASAKSWLFQSSRQGGVQDTPEWAVARDRIVKTPVVDAIIARVQSQIESWDSNDKLPKLIKVWGQVKGAGLTSALYSAAIHLSLKKIGVVAFVNHSTFRLQDLHQLDRCIIFCDEFYASSLLDQFDTFSTTSRLCFVVASDKNPDEEVKVKWTKDSMKSFRDILIQSCELGTDAVAIKAMDDAINDIEDCPFYMLPIVAVRREYRPLRLWIDDLFNKVDRDLLMLFAFLNYFLPSTNWTVLNDLELQEIINHGQVLLKNVTISGQNVSVFWHPEIARRIFNPSRNEDNPLPPSFGKSHIWELVIEYINTLKFKKNTKTSVVKGLLLEKRQGKYTEFVKSVVQQGLNENKDFLKSCFSISDTLEEVDMLILASKIHEDWNRFESSLDYAKQALSKGQKKMKSSSNFVYRWLACFQKAGYEDHKEEFKKQLRYYLNSIKLEPSKYTKLVRDLEALPKQFLESLGQEILEQLESFHKKMLNDTEERHIMEENDITEDDVASEGTLRN